MILRWVLMLGGILAGFAVLTIVNFWQIDHVGAKNLFGFRFRSVWGFWSLLALVAIPALVFSNILFWAVYYYGYHFWFKRLWIIQTATFAGWFLVMTAFTWFWYGELPQKGSLLGLLLCIAGAVASVVWR